MATPRSQLPAPPPRQPPEQQSPASAEPERELSTEELIDHVGRELKVPRGLRHSLFTQESGGEHYSRGGEVKTSPDGARGLGQLMPGTARRIGVNPDDPVENLVGSMYELRRLYDAARPNATDDAEAWARAVAGYFSGEGNIARTPGSIYRQNRTDGGGQSVEGYVTEVLSRWADFPDPDDDWSQDLSVMTGPAYDQLPVVMTGPAYEDLPNAQAAAQTNAQTNAPASPAAPASTPPATKLNEATVTGAGVAAANVQALSAETFDPSTREGREARDRSRQGKSAPGARQLITLQVDDPAKSSMREVLSTAILHAAAQRGVPENFTADWLRKHPEALTPVDTATNKPVELTQLPWNPNTRTVKVAIRSGAYIEDAYRKSQSPTAQAAGALASADYSPGEKIVAAATPLVEHGVQGMDYASRPFRAIDTTFWAKVHGADDALALKTAWDAFKGGDSVLGQNVLAEMVREGRIPDTSMTGLMKMLEHHARTGEWLEPTADFANVNPRLRTAVAGLTEMLAEPSNFIPVEAVGALAQTGRLGRLARGAGEAAESLKQFGTLERGLVAERPLGLMESVGDAVLQKYENVRPRIGDVVTHPHATIDGDVVVGVNKSGTKTYVSGEDGRVHAVPTENVQVKVKTETAEPAASTTPAAGATAEGEIHHEAAAAPPAATEAQAVTPVEGTTQIPAQPQPAVTAAGTSAPVAAPTFRTAKLDPATGEVRTGTSHAELNGAQADDYLRLLADRPDLLEQNGWVADDGTFVSIKDVSTHGGMEEAWAAKKGAEEGTAAATSTAAAPSTTSTTSTIAVPVTAPAPAAVEVPAEVLASQAPPPGISVPANPRNPEAGSVHIDLLTGGLLHDLPENAYPLGRGAEARAGWADTFISNFNKLRRISLDSFQTVLRAASSNAQTFNLLRANVRAITNATGQKWTDFSQLLIESRLRGIKETYENLAVAAETATDRQLLESFDPAWREFNVEHDPATNTYFITQLDDKGVGAVPGPAQARTYRTVESGIASPEDAHRRARELKSQGLMETMQALEKHPDMVPEVTQHVKTLLSNGQYQTARDVLAEDFRDAASKVQLQHTDPQFAALTSRPQFQEGLRLYKEHFEAPLTESHLRNEGVLAANKGPLDAYYPLIARDESGEVVARTTPKGFYSRLRAEWENPSNTLNKRASGLAEAYSGEVEDLKNVIKGAIRNNNIASMFDVLKSEGLALPFNRDADALLPGHVVRETKRTKRYMTKEGGFTVRGEEVQVPLWLVEELDPLLDGRIAGPRGWRYFMSKLTGAGLVGLLEPAIHSQNVIKNLTTTTPFVFRTQMAQRVFDTPLTRALDAAVTGALNLPVIKPLTTMAKLAAADPGTEHFLTQLGRLATAGALPEKTGAVTISREIAGQTGAELARFSPHKLAQSYLYGPGGIDTRARVQMLNILDSVKPDATPAEIYDFVNQMGVYNRALESRLSRWAKDTGVGPFYTAGQTRLRNGINAWLLRDNLPTETSIPHKLAQKLSGGAVGLLGTWALSYRAYTGMWPWQDDRARLLEIPLSDADRNSYLGQKFYGDGNNTAYISFGFASHVASGARALGLLAAANAHQAGGNWGQALEKGVAQAISSLAHPAVSAPGLHAGMAFFGAQTRLEGFRDDKGAFKPSLGAAVGTAQPGEGQLWKNLTEGVLDLNGFLSNIVAAAGEGHEGGQQAARGLDWEARTMKAILTLMAPEFIKGTRNTSLEKRYYIMQRRGAYVKEHVQEHREQR